VAAALLICISAQFPPSVKGQQLTDGEQRNGVTPAQLCADISRPPAPRIAICTQAIGEVAEELAREPRSKALKTEQGRLLDARANALVALGHSEEAIVSYTKAIELNGGDLVAFSSRSSLILDKDPDQKIPIESDLDEQVRKEWAEGIDFYDAGVKFESHREFGEAIEAYRHAVRLLPSFARAHADLGRLLKAKDPNAALAELSEAILLDPWIPGAPAFTARATLSLSLGQLEPALGDFNQIIARDNKNSVAYLNRGFIKETQGNLESALEDYNRSIEITPSASALFNRANVYIQIEEPAKALADFDAALALDPKNLPALIGKADLDYASGRLPESRDDYTLLVAAQPRKADWFFKRGNVYFDMGDFAAAYRDYSVSLALDPDQPDVLRNRALASEHMGAKQDAERDRQRASANQP
jgi:tetratricopeptide (TPR) repeat protein